jgi:hypothetical protein
LGLDVTLVVDVVEHALGTAIDPGALRNAISVGWAVEELDGLPLVVAVRTNSPTSALIVLYVSLGSWTLSDLGKGRNNGGGQDGQK